MAVCAQLDRTPSAQSAHTTSRKRLIALLRGSGATGKATAQSTRAIESGRIRKFQFLELHSLSANTFALRRNARIRPKRSDLGGAMPSITRIRVTLSRTACDFVRNGPPLPLSWRYAPLPSGASSAFRVWRDGYYSNRAGCATPAASFSEPLRRCEAPSTTSGAASIRSRRPPYWAKIHPVGLKDPSFGLAPDIRTVPDSSDTPQFRAPPTGAFRLESGRLPRSRAARLGRPTIWGVC